MYPYLQSLQKVSQKIELKEKSIPVSKIEILAQVFQNIHISMSYICMDFIFGGVKIGLF